METPYSHVAKVWGFGMAISGLNRGLTRFINRLPITLPDAPHILDAGCGTGIIGLSMLARYPDGYVLATDADANMCEAAKQAAVRRGYTPAQFAVRQADIHQPDTITTLAGTTECLAPATFDAVTTGAVLEHTDLDQSIPGLAALLKPGGWFINVAMGDKPIVKVYDMLFDCRPIAIHTIRKKITEYGFIDIAVIPLGAAEFPTNMTRIGIIARKAPVA